MQKYLGSFSALPLFLLALLLLVLQSAQALPFDSAPKLKPGLIESTLTVNGKTMQPMRVCVTDEQMKNSEKMGKDFEAKSKCTGQKHSQVGNTHYMEMTCNDTNGKPVLTKTEITLISENEFKMKSDTMRNGKPIHMENTSKRVGDCTGKENAMLMDKDGKQVDMKKMMEQIKKMKQQQQ